MNELKNLYIEYAKVFNTITMDHKKNIIKLFNEGKDVLFDIDWQGAKQLRESNYSKILSIFIVPPSKEAIYERLKFRTEKSGGNNQDIENRMKQFEIEMSHKDEYDFIVMNDDFETCVKRIEFIILDERKKN